MNEVIDYKYRYHKYQRSHKIKGRLQYWIISCVQNIIFQNEIKLQYIRVLPIYVPVSKCHLSSQQLELRT